MLKLAIGILFAFGMSVPAMAQNTATNTTAPVNANGRPMNMTPCARKGLSAACETVCQACQSAGFIVGDAKMGIGFWADCVDPIIQGKAQPKKATKTLPTVDAGTVAQCKSSNPQWGENHK